MLIIYLKILRIILINSQSEDEMLEVDIPEPVMKKPRFKQAVAEDTFNL
jgi:hypothetical protein